MGIQFCPTRVLSKSRLGSRSTEDTKEARVYWIPASGLDPRATPRPAILDTCAHHVLPNIPSLCFSLEHPALLWEACSVPPHPQGFGGSDLTSNSEERHMTQAWPIRALHPFLLPDYGDWFNEGQVTSQPSQ